MESQKPIQNFTDLNAWKESHNLALMIYATTRSFPRDELFGLTSQMRRSAVSAVSNIAEGFSCPSGREKAQFYSIANRSVVELQSQLMISRDVGYLKQEECDKILLQSIVVHKLINGLIKYARHAASHFP